MITLPRLRRTVAVAGFAAALALGGLAATASTASASTSPAQSGTALVLGKVAATSTASYSIVPVGAATPATVAPDACTSSNAHVILWGTRYDVFICVVGTVNTAGKGPFYELDSNVTNRIWLHQNANNSGWADCFRDVYGTGGEYWTLTGYRDAYPGNIQASANTAVC
jgi:hypothetical protein